MVTLENPQRPLAFKGKSTDTKPTEHWGDLEILNGESFLEIDTGSVYFYDKDVEDWVLPS